MKLLLILSNFLLIPFFSFSTDTITVETNIYSFFTDRILIGDRNYISGFHYDPESAELSNTEKLSLYRSELDKKLSHMGFDETNIPDDIEINFGQRFSDGISVGSAFIYKKMIDIKAIDDCRIIKTGYDEKYLGRYIITRSLRRSIYVAYGNLQNVYTSDRIKKGDSIGTTALDDSKYKLKIIIKYGDQYINPSKLVHLNKDVNVENMTLTPFGIEHTKYAADKRYHNITFSKLPSYYQDLLNNMEVTNPVRPSGLSDFYTFGNLVWDDKRTVLGNFYKINEELEVKAPLSGKIICVDYDPNGLGHNITIRNDSGLLIHIGNLSRMDVFRGNRVNAGDIIGLISKSKLSIEADLFLGLEIDNVYVDSQLLLDSNF